jgi:hypothetical protein
MLTVGIVGTAKNTGKTTTALCLLDQLNAAGVQMALTSIGYDGENRDGVTGLPKPRFSLQASAWVATAADCLSAGTAVLRIEKELPIRTALGPVCIAQVISPGTVLVAGPNRRIDLERLFIDFRSLGVRLTLVDGAINRLVPMIATDGLVLSTGAAFQADIPAIVRHMRALRDLIEAPAISTHSFPEKAIGIQFMDGEWVENQPGSLLSDRSLAGLLTAISRPVEALSIPGACDPVRLDTLVTAAGKYLTGAQVIFADPLKLVASADALRWQEVIAKLSERAIKVCYQQRSPILWVTTNPFYPRYREGSGVYEPAYLDAGALLQAMRAALHPTLVVDVMQPPVPDFLALLGLREERTT